MRGVAAIVLTNLFGTRCGSGTVDCGFFSIFRLYFLRSSCVVRRPVGSPVPSEHRSLSPPLRSVFHRSGSPFPFSLGFSSSPILRFAARCVPLPPSDLKHRVASSLDE